MDTEEGQRALKELLALGAWPNTSAAQQAIVHELEKRHPFSNMQKPVAAAVSRSLDGFTHQYYTRICEDNDALVAYIIREGRDYSPTNYALTNVDMTAAKMRPVTPQAVSRPEMAGITAANGILGTNKPYVTAVLAAYDEVVRTTDSKTDT